MKKHGTAIIMLILVLLSVGAVVGYEYYERTSSSPSLPTIAFDSDTVTVGVNYTDAELLAGVTATDPEDGDVTDSLIVEGISRYVGDGTATVSYAAFDSCDHMVRAERKVHFKDYESPSFELTAPLVFKSGGEVNILSYIKASDVFDGDISDSVKYTLLGKSLTLSEVGDHRVQLRVTSKLGDSVSLELPVTVTEREPNSAGITLTDYLIFVKIGAEFDAESYVDGYTVNDEYRSGASGLTVESNVDMQTEGVYTVDYTYGYGDGKSMTRLIVVVG